MQEVYSVRAVVVTSGDEIDMMAEFVGVVEELGFDPGFRVQNGINDAG
jgi:hypothetical protein